MPVFWCCSRLAISDVFIKPKLLESCDCMKICTFSLSDGTVSSSHEQKG